MFSATDFFPAYITEFMNFVMMMFPNFGSGSTSRFSAEWRRDILICSRLFRTFRAVVRTTLLAVLDALGIEDAAENVVAHAGQILDAAAADHDHGMLLKVMAFTRNVADDFEAIGQAHLGDLAKRRVRLLRGRGVDARANAALLRRLLQRRHLLARLLYDARTCDQLVDRRHVSLHPLFVRNREAAAQILNRDHRSHPVTPRELNRAKRNRANRSLLSGKRFDATEDRSRNRSA